jgi:hypothetical protein
MGWFIRPGSKGSGRFVFRVRSLTSYIYWILSSFGFICGGVQIPGIDIAFRTLNSGVSSLIPGIEGRFGHVLKFIRAHLSGVIRPSADSENECGGRGSAVLASVIIGWAKNV